MAVDRPVRCPFGTLYDAAIHTECPCPSCWADRSFAKLTTNQPQVATQKVGLEPKTSPPADSKRRKPPKSATTDSSRQITSPIGTLTTGQGAAALSIVVALTATAVYLVYKVSSEKPSQHATASSSISSSDEEKIYRAARGDISQLQSYVKTCKACGFKAAANEEISYLSARGNLDQLKAYVRGCQSCEFAAAAGDEIRDLEYKASMFTFEVCNRTSYQVAIAATVRKSVDTSDWTIRGWGLVDAGACKPIGEFARDKVYAVAMTKGDRKGWYGKDAKHCVEFPGPFERDAAADASCPSSGRVLGFREFKVTTDQHTWTLDTEPAFAEDEFFALQVCNQSSYRAAVALAGRPVPAGDWILEGWRQIDAGACGGFGRFAKGKIYAMAKVHNEALGWYGTDTKLCVEIPGPFNRVVSPNSACPPNGKIVGFRAFDVTDDKYTWAISGTPSFSDDDFFAFEVCNKSGKRASVAVMGRSDPASPFIIQGWHTVTAGSCETIGRFARGTFYAMASLWGDVTRGWWQKDIQLCVKLPGPFNRVNSESYKCGRNEKLVPFRKFSITSPKQTWTLN